MKPDNPIVNRKSCNPSENVRSIDFDMRRVSTKIKRAKSMFELRFPFLDKSEYMIRIKLFTIPIILPIRIIVFI